MSEVFFILARSSKLIDDLIPYYLVLIFLNVKKRNVVFICANFIYMFRCLLWVLLFNKPRVYCCICVQFNVKPRRRIHNILKKAWEEYFEDEVRSGQEWAPHGFLNSYLRRERNGRPAMPTDTLVTWRESKTAYLIDTFTWLMFPSAHPTTDAACYK
jgi:hypothetical protein